MSDWVWLTLTDAAPSGASAAARAVEAVSGTPAGGRGLGAGRARPGGAARRVARRLLDPGGAAAHVSLVRPRAGARLPFDDLAAQQARRDVLARPPADA